jgi:uncharacterized cysteine cluster protein YcgN (CxxCxxCC family)
VQQTANLMDYAGGTDLWKYQWDLIHNPESILFAWGQDEEEGEFIYGITWLGNYLWGLAPDEQESQIETNRALFKHVYENYDKYFDDSKSKDINLDLESHQSWSVRKASHQGIAKKVFKGVKEDKTSFSLHYEGVYFEEYTLEDIGYKVSVYSKIEAVSLNQNVRIKSFKALRENKFIKVGYTSDYGLIVFYDASGKMQMVLQIIGGKTPKEAVTQWMNYLGILLPSEEQQEEDKENSIQEMLKSVQLYALGKLNEIWGEETEALKYETVFLDDVQWVSQFDSVFSSSPCYDSDACCFVASNQILSYSGVSTNRAQQVVIAQTTSSTCDNLTATDLFNEGIELINISLEEHKLPIVVGVHHPKKNKTTQAWYHYCSGNTPSVTNHYIVIVGKGYDETVKKNYFRFYEVGTSHSSNGKSPENKLYIEDSSLIIGDTKYVNKSGYYTVTEVRKNIGETYTISNKD